MKTQMTQIQNNKTPEADNQRNEIRGDTWQDGRGRKFTAPVQTDKADMDARLAAAPAQAQHSPLGGLNVEVAKSKRWPGYTWQDYQTAIVRQNHHISKVEAHAQRLADALTKIGNTHVIEGQRIAREALAEWSKAQ